MTDAAPLDPSDATAPDAVTGGGPGPAGTVSDPVDQAVAHLELLSPSARDAVLDRMDPALAERLRMRLASTPDRPHGQFSRDVVARRRMLREMTERIHAGNAERHAQDTERATQAAARPQPAPHVVAAPVPHAAAPAAPTAPAGPVDPLEPLRNLHPAAIARAMQGERAEAWAIVLERLDVTARAALQMYLEPAARAAIDEARARQQDLAASSPQLAETIEAAIARTVVPRAMREHHQLLSTTPLAWNA